jgi:hypothetical protein
MKMIVESMMEYRLAGKPKFSEKTCPSTTFVHHKIPRAHPGLNPGRRGGKPATNRLSYGAALSRYSDRLWAGRPAFNSWQWQKISLFSIALKPAVGL